MRTRIAIAVLSLLAIGGAAACGSDTDSTNAGSGDTKQSSDLTGTSWQLTAVHGPNGTALPAASDAMATLAFESRGMLTGSTGCNQLSGTYTVDGNDLTIKPGPQTMAACPSAALTAQETAVVQLLPKTITYTVDADGLTLIGADDVTLLSYEKGLDGLTDTKWTVTGVNNGKGAVDTNAQTESLDATFGADGAFSANGGCNQLSGAYQTSGSDGLAITGVTATQKACDTAIDAVEAQYIAALESVTTYTITGDQLTLRDDTGAAQVTLSLQA